MTLIGETLHLLRVQSPQVAVVFLIELLSAFVDVWFGVSGTIMYAIYKVVTIPLLDFVKSRILHAAGKKLSSCYIKRGYEDYTRSTYASKQKVHIADFGERLNECVGAMETVTKWGINTIAFLVANASVCMYVLGWCTVVVAAAVIALSARALFRYHRTWAESDRECKKKIQTARVKRRLRMQLLGLPGATTTSVNRSVDELIGLGEQMARRRMVFEMAAFMLSRVVFLAVPFVGQRSGVLIIALTPFAMAVNMAVEFLKQYTSLEGSYTSYRETVEGMQFAKPAVEHQFPGMITVDEIFVPNEAQGGQGPPRLQFAEKPGTRNTVSPSIDFESGRRYLVRGASGSGKTTFINALMGKIDGIRLRGISQPENLVNCYAEFNQKMCENFPTSHITVRELFAERIGAPVYGPEIKEFLDIVCLDAWLGRVGLDRNIGENISPGEKTRLSLATVLAMAQTKPCLVLDEPDQGIDPPCAYMIMKNIFDRYPEKMIIVITHLEKADSNKFGWEDIIHIDSGRVRV